MFGTTTVIFILATAAIVIGPALTSQGIPMIVKFIDSSFVIGWSPHKMNVATGVIATIIKVNARFHAFRLVLCALIYQGYCSPS